jgi:hypothetical protein
MKSAPKAIPPPLILVWRTIRSTKPSHLRMSFRNSCRRQQVYSVSALVEVLVQVIDTEVAEHREVGYMAAVDTADIRRARAQALYTVPFHASPYQEAHQLYGHNSMGIFLAFLSVLRLSTNLG